MVAGICPVARRSPGQTLATEMIAGAIFGNHAILGLAGADERVGKLIDHVWVAIAAQPEGSPKKG